MILSENDRAYCCEGRKSNEFITIRGKNDLIIIIIIIIIL